MSHKHITRRDALKQGLAATAALGLAGGRMPVLGADKPVSPLTLPRKAKSVIQIWMWGGPCHIDTFDPKPGAGKDYTGPLDKPIGTNVDGIRIGQLLPNLARHADKYAIIRSLTHGNNGHETASYITQTGHRPGRLLYPCIGSVISKVIGDSGEYKGIVPPYIVLTRPQGRFSESGFLGPKYKPFSTGGDPNRNPFQVEGIIARGISDSRQKSRRQLLHDLDLLGKAMNDNEQFGLFDQGEEYSYDMIFGKARDLFDLNKEKAELRDRYGRNTFGQSCLAARRLVEHGVPYITINYNGWDTHKQHFDIMNRKLPEMDQAMGTLFEDLAERGLLDSTVIWWSGEFGRGPKVQWESPWNGGRSHYGKCFCTLLAGGGIKGGQVIGKSDSKGMEVDDRAVYPADVLAAIYQQMGIDPDGILPNPLGLDLKVMPPDENGGQRLTELA